MQISSPILTLLILISLSISSLLISSTAASIISEGHICSDLNGDGGGGGGSSTSDLEECGARGKSPSRIIVIGDVHGSSEGLSELLFRSNITVDISTCLWRDQSIYRRGTLLVQVGDIVDRYP